MQNLDLGEQQQPNNTTRGSSVTPSSPIVGGDNLNFDPDGVPSPPQDNNQVAAWYDTDL